nr:Zinc knuckle family protein [Ipomoea batatas]
MPIHPSDLWTKTGEKPPLPPKYKVQPGRPKKLRKRDPIENESVVGDKLVGKLSRKGEKKKCSICGQYGHNKLSCKNQKQNDVEPTAAIEVEHPVATETEVETLVADIATETQPSPSQSQCTQIHRETTPSQTVGKAQKRRKLSQGYAPRKTKQHK